MAGLKYIVPANPTLSNIRDEIPVLCINTCSEPKTLDEETCHNLEVPEKRFAGSSTGLFATRPNLMQMSRIVDQRMKTIAKTRRKRISQTYMEKDWETDCAVRYQATW